MPSDAGYARWTRPVGPPLTGTASVLTVSLFQPGSTGQVPLAAAEPLVGASRSCDDAGTGVGSLDDACGYQRQCCSCANVARIEFRSSANKGAIDEGSRI